MGESGNPIARAIVDQHEVTKELAQLVGQYSDLLINHATAIRWLMFAPMVTQIGLLVAVISLATR